MKRTLKSMLAVASVAVLGALASVVLLGTSATASTADVTTTAATTTEPATTTAPTMTTTPTTTTAPTTTAPSTTTAPTTTAATTTAPTTTTGPGVTQSTPQTTTGPSPGGTTTAQTQTQPCQTPTNPGVTCGNNAATQLAVVTQNCDSNATVATGGLTIQVLNPDGSVAKNVGIDNKSICLNYAQITQIVTQICVNCTLVVENHYHHTTNQTNQTVVNGWSGPRYVGYCMPADRPRERGDGTVGWLVFIEEGRPDRDPVYKGATRAPFDQANGYTCPGTGSAAVPNTFTLTVPAAFIGRFVNLCLQPADPKAKPICHSLKIDGSSKFTIPVSSNIKASITKTPKSKLVGRKSTDVGAGLLGTHVKKRCVGNAKTQKTLKTVKVVKNKQCVTPKHKRRVK